MRPGPVRSGREPPIEKVGRAWKRQGRRARPTIACRHDGGSSQVRALATRDAKDGVQRRDPPQLVVWRIGADTLEEGADLPGPLLEVRAEEQHLLVVGNLGRGELLEPAALPQAALTARPQVAHPLRLAAR